MATLKKGIFGPASGSVGNVIFSSRYGKPYIRSRPARVSNPQTPKQQASRMLMKLLSPMLSTFKPFIRAGFTDIPLGKSARDIAYSTNGRGVLKGEYPDIEIDYSLVKVSSGPLEPAGEASMELNGQTLGFTWNPASQSGKPFANDDIGMVLAYNSESGSVAYSLRAAERRAGSCELELPAEMAAEPQNLHGWISFVSSDGKMASESRYVL